MVGTTVWRFLGVFFVGLGPLGGHGTIRFVERRELDLDASFEGDGTADLGLGILDFFSGFADVMSSRLTGVIALTTDPSDGILDFGRPVSDGAKAKDGGFPDIFKDIFTNAQWFGKCVTSDNNR